MLRYTDAEWHPQPSVFAALPGWLESRATAEVLLLRVKSGSRVHNQTVNNGEDKGFWSHTCLGSFLGSVTYQLLNLSALSFLVCKTGMITGPFHEVVKIT